METVLIFIGIFAVALIATWCIIYGPKVVVHEHEHHYKFSRDYDHLWDIIVKYKVQACVRNQNSTAFYYNNVYLNKQGNKIYGLGEVFDLSMKGKDEFVAYCKYKQIEFLDFVEDLEGFEAK